MTETEIKPCRYCGGNVYYRHENFPELKFSTHTFTCKKCRMDFRALEKSKRAQKVYTKSEAIAIYNEMATKDIFCQEVGK